MNAQLKANPDLQLLIELEPAHRVFLRNLSDTFTARPQGAIATGVKAAPFWKDVFVDSGLPWSAFMESMLWHIAVVSVLWTVSQTWIKQEQIQQRRTSHESLTYYPPPKNFPALHARPPRPRQHSLPQQNAGKTALHVAHEQEHARTTSAPDLKFARSQPNIPLPSSAVPIFAPRLAPAAIPQARAVALAPAADIGKSTNRRLNLPQASAVAPPTNVASVSSRRAIPSTNSGPVAPAPPSPSAMSKSAAANLGEPLAVNVAPHLNSSSQNGILQRASINLARPTIVPPPVSAGASSIGGTKRPVTRIEATAIPPSPNAIGPGSSGHGKSPLPFQAASGVAPSPSIGAAVGRSDHPISLAGSTALAVAPAPSGTGRSIGGLRISSIPSSGITAAIPVVPPAASIAGSLSGGGRIAPSPGDNSHAVPPSPSGVGSRNNAASQRASLGDSSQAVLAPGAAAISANTAARNSASALVQTAVPPAPEPGGPSIPASIELPIRVIGQALSLPNSSYFSNYEVFIAERRLKKGDPELIKLVYESLPYQPRLAEYGLDNSKVYRLRVTRDPACDETLLQMTWPQTDEAHSGSKYATGPPALAPNEKNSLLPCYRTTADDYRLAVTRNH